jgi:hypothetical protein
MAWPTTKATTTHLDAGTDDPNQARPQIKQNIDNVNDIIDFFPSGVIDIGNQTVVLQLGDDGNLPTLGSGTEYNTITEHYDGGNLCTIGSVSLGSTFVLASGTYLMNCNAVYHDSDTQSVNVLNVTGASTIATGKVNEIGTTGDSMQSAIDNTVFTSNGTDSLAIQFWGSSTVSGIRDGFKIRFTKIA